jgi:O-antigen ligase
MSGPRVDPAAGAAPDTGGAAPADWAGAPLRSTLKFLAFPAALAIAILVLRVSLPSPVLYGVAGVLGLVMLGRVFRDPEWLLAVFVLYIPLCRTFVVPIAPGINGTNSLLALMLLTWTAKAGREGRPMFVEMPNSRLIGWLGAVTSVSVLTAGFSFGFGDVFGAYSNDIKGWVEQFFVFFAFLHLIRDGAMARRVVLYMMLGAVVVLALGTLEWMDKRFYESIEKARLLGPQMQPNDFGAFLVYIAGPFLALFLTQVRRPRAWLALPFFALLGRVLLATFSRGAFIGIAVAGVAAGYVRGRAFLLAMGLLGAGLLVAMPELVPDSLMDRMSSTTADTGASEAELDSSSQTRLVLWKAAIDMTLESPLLGKGFKAFPRLKSDYTESYVREYDNHNMYLYICSQMGIPALLLFLWLIYRTWELGVRVYRSVGDVFGRAVGMGGAAMAAGLAAVNMFGSRMTDMTVSAYVWIYLAALAHMWVEVESRQRPADAAGGAGP